MMIKTQVKFFCDCEKGVTKEEVFFDLSKAKWRDSELFIIDGMPFGKYDDDGYKIIIACRINAGTSWEDINLHELLKGGAE